MATVALGLRLLLALVFATAAAGKLADQQGTRGTLGDFGMPEWSRAPLALLLPLAELATAVALVIEQSARWGAIAALSLLVLFAAGIAGAMARGEAPDCHCFGQISSAPAGRGTLIRNAFLAAPAVFITAYGPGDAIDSWLSARSATELVATGTGIATVALAAFCLRLLTENRRLHRDLDRSEEQLAAFPPGLPVGAPAPQFALPSIDGQTVTLDGLLATGKPAALVFVSPDCGPCLAMFPDLARWQARLEDRIAIIPIASGTSGELRQLSERYGLANVLVQKDGEVFRAYRGNASPSVVIVTPDGRIGSRMRSTQVVVEGLIRRALRDTAAGGQRPTAGNATPFEVLQA